MAGAVAAGAKHAVDELVDPLALLLALGDLLFGIGTLPDQIGLDLLIHIPKRRHIDDQVPDHLEIGQRFQDDRIGVEDGHLRPAGEINLAVDHHGAGSANSGATGAPKGKRPVDLVTDPEQHREHRQSGNDTDPVGGEAGPPFRFPCVIPEDLEGICTLFDQ